MGVQMASDPVRLIVKEDLAALCISAALFAGRTGVLIAMLALVL
jgi:hypothetical protein